MFEFVRVLQCRNDEAKAGHDFIDEVDNLSIVAGTLIDVFHTLI